MSTDVADKKVLLITGPRTWGAVVRDGAAPLTDNEPARILAEADAIKHYVGLLSPEVVVMHGGAGGLDSGFARKADAAKLITVKVPYFGFLGKTGGFERNQAMIDMVHGLELAGWQIRCWAFGSQDHGGGTADCARRMEVAGFDVRWIPRPVEIRVPG